MKHQYSHSLDDNVTLGQPEGYAYKSTQDSNEYPALESKVNSNALTAKERSIVADIILRCNSYFVDLFCCSAFRILYHNLYVIAGSACRLEGCALCCEFRSHRTPFGLG